MAVDNRVKSTGQYCVMKHPQVSLEKVHKAFGRLTVLDGVDLAVHPGQALVILGESGSGKTVLLKHMLGLIEPDSGRVFFEGREVSAMSERELVDLRRQFGYVFQSAALFDSLTVGENVAFPLRQHSNTPETELRHIVRDKLAMVGLHDVEEKMPAELSGGMKKRVGIARALAAEPKVVVYDEPTAGLDPIKANLIDHLTARLHQELHVTTIVVTHDLQCAFRVAQRIVLLWKGRLIEGGSPEQVQSTNIPELASFVKGQPVEAQEA